MSTSTRWRVARGVFALGTLGFGGCGSVPQVSDPAVALERRHGSPDDHGDGSVDDQGGIGTVVATTAGPVRGFVDGTVLTFRGIPYAKPPVGDLRWRAPQPPDRWHGVRDATAFGSACVQSWDPTVGSEDCLVLNVFVPEGTRPNAKLPTMVHLHGGGNAGGSAHEDASLLVSRGVVVVTLNYRMNVFGFLAHPALTAETGHSSNYGLLDQIAALQWVAANIRSFGGDPDNVTLFGMSAGSFDTTALAASPLTDDLVDRAAIQGSVPWADSLSWAERQGKRVAQGVGCSDASDVAACLRKADVGLLNEVMGDWFQDIVPVRDGYVLPDYPARLLEHKHLDLLIGNDREEASGWYVGWWPDDYSEEEYNALTLSEDWAGPYGAELLAAYPASDYDTPMWGLVAQDTDYAYTCSTRRVALNVAEQEPEVWRYLFTHTYDHAAVDGFPLPDYRAHHFFEEQFLWDEWDDWGGPNGWYEPTDAERQLGGQMADYWTNFARTGDPNGGHLPTWPRYDAHAEQILLLDTPSTASEAYHVPQCEVLEQIQDYFIFSRPDDPEPPPVDPNAPYGFDDSCAGGTCLHNCRPYPKSVVVSAGVVAPNTDYFCLANEPSDDTCSTCTRTLVQRVERRPADGPIDLLGEPGWDFVAEYTDAGTWPVTGTGLPLVPGYCYRTAAQVELANGYAAGLAYGDFTCF